ncbi:hypothetical protein CPC08DRAFT_824636 [Agrocybe pediades]|nr:hypothetical protein CPC08DRAFT_824636 [Agrocybe pediades]
MPPSPPIQQQIRNRTVLEELLAECDDFATQLADLAEANQRQRLAVRNAMNDTVPLNSVIPEEIITKIFSLVRQDQLDRRARGSFVPLPSPFLLSQVCRTWRKGIHSNARLWNIVTIQPSPRRYERQIELIKEQLFRARSLKLDIYVVGGWLTPPRDLFDLFLGYSSQWRTFEIFLCEGLSQALSRQEYSFPSLRSLVQKGHRLNGTFDFDGFNVTGKLATLVLDLPDKLILGQEGLFQWPNHLRSLELRTHFGGRLIDILKLCNRLEILTLKLSVLNGRHSHDVVSPTPITPILLSYLTQLTVMDWCPYESSDTGGYRLLNYINAPGLKRLTVDSSDDTWIIIDRYRNSVVELTIRNRSQVQSEWRCLTTSFPSLVQLTIQEHSACLVRSLSDEFIELLNPTGPHGNLNLKNLAHIEYRGEISFSLDAMIAMVRNRLAYSNSHGFAVLKTFDIKYTNQHWARDITARDPNAWSSFYLEVGRLAAAGTNLNLQWASSPWNEF